MRSRQVVPLEMTPPEAVAELVEEVLGEGGLVVFPTDTVYGLGARADDFRGLSRIFALKHRPRDRALPILVGGQDQVKQAAAEWPETAQKLAAAFWPGPLTIVVPAVDSLPPLLTGGKPTVGLRMPDHRATLEWLREGDFLVATTSANLSGKPAPARIEEIDGELLQEVELVLLGEDCPGGVPSTVVEVKGEEVRLLREGPVSLEELNRVVEGQIVERGV
jgi:L-threonylcarbamoyladenylate synthase